MSQFSLTVRLPTGREYWYSSNVPEVGTKLTHAGRSYIVLSCEPVDDDRFIVTLAGEEATGDSIAVSPPG